MVFSSVEFLLYFLPIFFVLYGLIPNKYKNFTLLVGSLVFYTLGEPHYLALLLGSVLANYLIGRLLGKREKYREQYKNRNSKKNKARYKNYIGWLKVLFIAAVFGNVGVLLIFKVAMGGETLPLGVSFYTFQILSYLIDVYRGDIPAEHSFVKTATYVTMFPQLVSGPIVNYAEVSAALYKRRMTWRSIQSGLKLFTLGLVAKVLLADRVGLLWNDVQVRGFESISTWLAWLGAIAYSMKIYFDFAGYSLMAMGLGVMMGFTLPENFKTPYMARSVRDFYRRWHMTLGRWFRNYVYIPLGGNRKGELCTVRNLLIVWALTGLWHGGRGNFLIWGMLLWGIIVMERQVTRLTERFSTAGKRVWNRMRILPRLYLWAVIPVTWMCFAITDVKELFVYLGRMFGTAPKYVILRNDWLITLQSYGVLFAVCFVACTPFAKRIFLRWKDSAVGNVILAALFWICVWRIMVEGNNPFLYFKSF